MLDHQPRPAVRYIPNRDARSQRYARHPEKTPRVLARAPVASVQSASEARSRPRRPPNTQARQAARQPSLAPSEPPQSHSILTVPWCACPRNVYAFKRQHPPPPSTSQHATACRITLSRSDLDAPHTGGSSRPGDAEPRERDRFRTTWAMRAPQPDAAAITNDEHRLRRLCTARSLLLGCSRALQEQRTRLGLRGHGAKASRAVHVRLARGSCREAAVALAAQSAAAIPM